MIRSACFVCGEYFSNIELRLCNECGEPCCPGCLSSYIAADTEIVCHACEEQHNDEG